MSVGERITTLRKSRELSQGQLATLMGVSRQAISKWENDQTTPDTLNLIRLTEVLDSDIEYIATGVERVDMSEVEPIIHTVVREVERIVPVERVVVKPIIRRKVQVRYRNHPGHMLLLGVSCFLIGLILGCLILRHLSPA